MWAARCQRTADVRRQTSLMARLMANTASYFVKLVEISACLRNTKRIRECVTNCLGLMVEGADTNELMADAMAEVTAKGLPKSLDATAARFVMDVGYMLAHREMNLMATHVRWLQWTVRRSTARTT